jgi:hypothetical protein
MGVVLAGINSSTSIGRVCNYGLGWFAILHTG